MSVLVKNMQMPKDCPICPFAHWTKVTDVFTGCDIVGGKKHIMLKDEEYANSSTRPDWCPLVELPKGEWLRMSDLSEKDDNRYKCSRCGNVIHHKSRMDLYTFNSWCGRCGSNNRKADKWEEDAPTVIGAEEVKE